MATGQHSHNFDDAEVEALIASAVDGGSADTPEALEVLRAIAAVTGDQSLGEKIEAWSKSSLPPAKALTNPETK